MDLTAKLKQLKDWLDQGLLDQAAYNAQVSAALSGFQAGGAASAGQSEGHGGPARGQRKTLLELSVGDEVGPADRRYRLERFVDQGGMGAVWKATDLAAVRHHAPSGRQAPSVALKLLPADLQGSPRHKQMLVEEADNARMLGHPNIVRVHGWRECAVTGLPFIEMEYLESTATAGGDLDTILQREGRPGLSYQRVIELLTPITQALDYAWKEHQLAHRDLKPGNVFVTADGKVKLLDFGIAARARSTASSLNLGPSPGSPGYRAPEAAANHSISPKLDVYSLAVLIYELLQGEPPFTDQRGPHTPWPEAPKSLKPEQWEVLKAGLAFEPDKRPDTASQLLHRLGSDRQTNRQTWSARQATTTPPLPRQQPRTDPVARPRSEAPARRPVISTRDALTPNVEAVCRPLSVFRDEFKQGPWKGPAMIWLPQGSFLMGSLETEPERDGNEGPQHQVQIRYPLAVGQGAVTFDEFDAFWADSGYHYKPDELGWGRGQRPVINVSWHDAQAYAKWLSQKTGEKYRLLSEAEWEYAARAGTSTAFWWGNSITTDQANYDGNYRYNGSPQGEYRKKTLEVHSFQPNPWGLYQVHGNVWEWVQDQWHVNYEGAPVDGSAWEAGGREEDKRVLRGASWGDYPWNLRAAIRVRGDAGDRNSGNGFRLARTVKS
jgi:formylglycine-generating enzyme required for sulfatase activity